MTQSGSIYILIPVHNRRSVTLKCLSHLQQQGALDRYSVVVIDDGSTDGTAETIRAHYPTVILLTGDGDLWWTGAIAKGMEYAISKGANYLIWLNDDCLPQPGAIETLLYVVKQNAQIIAGGQSLDPKTLEPSYGGVTLKRGKIQPINAALNDSNDSLECDGLNGNFVCFSQEVVQSIGYPNVQFFPQYHGDTTYTHTAKKQGYKLLLVRNAIAHCHNDHAYLPGLGYWLESDRSPWDLWQELFRLNSPNYWKAELGLYTEFFGVLGVWFYLRDRLIRFIMITLIVLILPLKYRVKLMPLFTRLKAAQGYFIQSTSNRFGNG